MEFILTLAIILLYPFFFTGLINRFKAMWAGRQGPDVFQQFRDFFRLMKKGEVISTASSFIFQLAPSVNLGAILTAALMVPVFSHTPVLHFEYDFIVFMYLLALGKFFSILSGFDTGSSFSGMGAVREAGFSVFAEPAFLVVLASLCCYTGIFSFSGLYHTFDKSGLSFFIINGLSAVVLFMLILIEGSRLPVDDPNTHLELTMVHEVMVLDNSGINLAFIQYANALKMSLYTFLLISLLIPKGLHPLAFSGIMAGVTLAVTALIGTIESLIARLRLTHVPQFILMLSSIGLIVMATIVFVSLGRI